MNRIETRGIVGGDYFIDGIVGGDYFLVSKRNSGSLYLSDIKFNIDNYNIYKASNRFRQLEYKEFQTQKYSKYFFIKKELDINTNEWIDFIYKTIKLSNWHVSRLRLAFINKPFPNIDPNKIKIIEWQTLKNQTN